MEWQKIRTAPRDGTYVLTTVRGVHDVTGKPFIPLVTRYADGVWGCELWAEDGKSYQPTHWMPLPETPE